MPIEQCYNLTLPAIHVPFIQVTLQGSISFQLKFFQDLDDLLIEPSWFLEVHQKNQWTQSVHANYNVQSIIILFPPILI